MGEGGKKKKIILLTMWLQQRSLLYPVDILAHSQCGTSEGLTSCTLPFQVYPHRAAHSSFHTELPLEPAGGDAQTSIQAQAVVTRPC